MKTLLLLFSLLYGVAFAAQCNNAWDPKKVVLFLDVNGSYPEAVAAEAAACRMGQRFVMFPSMEQSKVVFEAERDYNQSLTAQTRACRSPQSSACQSVTAGHNRITSNLTSLKSRIKKVSPSEVAGVLTYAASQDWAVTSVVLSGHDGGGQVMGASGQIDKTEFLQAYNYAYRAKPNLKNQLNSVFMWGCYTSTPGEILEWKAALPSVKVIGGFYGSAPASSRPVSSSILTDLLEQTDSLSNICDEARLRTAIRGISGITSTTAGVYVRTSCGNQDWLFNQTPNGTQWGRLDGALLCSQNSTYIRNATEAVQKYYQGQLAIPADTSRSDLRQAYSLSRQMSQCFADQAGAMNADRVGLLLFYKGVQENFPRVFANDMAAGQNSFNGLERALASASGNNVGNFLGLLNAAKEAVGTNGLLRAHQMPRAELATMLSRLSPLMNHPALAANPALAASLAPLRKAYRIMDSYLYKLEPRCMNFLQWHESVPHRVPTARCQY